LCYNKLHRAPPRVVLHVIVAFPGGVIRYQSQSCKSTLLEFQAILVMWIRKTLLRTYILDTHIHLLAWLSLFK